MRRLTSSILAASLALFAASASAGAQTPGPAAVDPNIARAVARVYAARLRADDTRLVAFGSRSTFSEKLGPKRGVFAARAWIADQFREAATHSNGRMTVAYDTYLQKADGRRVPRDVEISSVIATLKGDDSDGRTYVMSSHYDSRNSSNEDATKDAPGADDNGSGTVAVIEAARALASVPVHGTVIFATYDAEEQGLFGSAHHAAGLKSRNVDVRANLNNDIIGASVGPHGERDAVTVRIFSEALIPSATAARTNALGNENDSPSRELARFAKQTGEAYVTGTKAQLVFRADRFLRGGDHLSFNAQGFPAIRFVEPAETFTHQHQDVRLEGGVQYGDLLRYVDFDYLARVTKVNIAALATLALACSEPRNVHIATRELSYDTTLLWDRVPGAIGYEIVARRTEQPTWTSVIAAGDVSEFTVPLMKDDWLFGVRAVDAAGRRSVAAFPEPIR